MALPKRRHSRARGRKRRTHWKLSAPNVISCTNCGQSKLLHHVCPHCGFYRDKQIVQVKEV